MKNFHPINSRAEAYRATEAPKPPADVTPRPQNDAGPPPAGAGDSGKSSNERSALSATNHGPVVRTERPGKAPQVPTAVAPGPVRGTAENDRAIASMYPALGDSVRVDVERVPFMEQKAIHQRVRASGVHGQLGKVIGSQVVDGVYCLRVETAQANVLVPAECCGLESVPLTPEIEMHEGRTSPERMRKPGPGSYNLT